MLLTIVSFILVLGILVFFHEMGHYISAKLTGIRVEEFALGFGPKLVTHKKGDTVYSIRIVPLGGFCKMTGESPPDEGMSEEEKRIYEEACKKGQCFNQKSPFKRLLVLFNGSFMNFVLAAIIFILIFSTYGLPVESTNTNIIGDIVPGHPAAEAGFEVGDQIITIDSQEINNWEDLASIIHNSSGEKLRVKFIRDNQVMEKEVIPRYDDTIEGGVIGISPKLVRQQIGFFRAVYLGVIQAWLVLKATLIGFVMMITGKVAADIGGPVMIASMVGQAANIGLLSLLNLTAIISVNLGIFNLLPFPALDGGRIIFVFGELIRGKPIDPEKENVVHVIGFAILIKLMIFLVFRDLGRTIF